MEDTFVSCPGYSHSLAVTSGSLVFLFSREGGAGQKRVSSPVTHTLTHTLTNVTHNPVTHTLLLSPKVVRVHFPGDRASIGRETTHGCECTLDRGEKASRLNTREQEAFPYDC